MLQYPSRCRTLAVIVAIVDAELGEEIPLEQAIAPALLRDFMAGVVLRGASRNRLQFGQSGFYLVIYGALFLVILLLLPQGVVPTLRARWTRFKVARSQQEEVAVSDTALPKRGEPRDTERKEGINL